jgi:hypothetical protein
LSAERRQLTIDYKKITPDDFMEWIFKQNEIENHKGCAEICEDYISRFDDQNEDIWNFLYISNRRLIVRAS